MISFGSNDILYLILTSDFQIALPLLNDPILPQVQEEPLHGCHQEDEERGARPTVNVKVRTSIPTTPLVVTRGRPVVVFLAQWRAFYHAPHPTTIHLSGPPCTIIPWPSSDSLSKLEG